MRLATPLFALAALLTVPALAPALTIETVVVGNPANPADSLSGTPIGRVDYEFNIGKYEVTNSQYAEFLNAVDPSGANSRNLYNSNMTSSVRGGINFSAGGGNGQKYSIKPGYGNNPVVFVSFYDAARFSNWMHNGQGAGNTEDGAYLLSNGELAARKITASWCLPNANEWYKAAFHKNDGITGNYWDYAVASDAIPISDQPPGVAPNQPFSANFKRDDALANGFNDGFAVSGSGTLDPAVNYLTNVGAYAQADGPYGTFDQNGNVWEWTDTLVATFPNRIIGGGSWFNEATLLAAATQTNTQADGEFDTIGFRVARVTPAMLPGDYNGNGTVDAADYTIWRDTYHSTTDLRANGDDTGASDDFIDEADYAVWKQNFGSTGGAGATTAASNSVPEPATLFVLIASALLLLGASRRLPKVLSEAEGRLS